MIPPRTRAEARQSRGSPPQSGLLLLNKKSGITSFDSLGSVKKALATGKVGHTGTLDKFASGLLLVLAGRGVKLAPLFENCVKEYTGTVFFGAETDTLDPEGKIIAEAKLPTREETEAVLVGFRGDILQSPPAYSAIHVNGRRAYELARNGKEPQMKKRPCTVYELEITSWTPPLAVIYARVSAGTYIRSLARDIALAAGSRAYLTALKRTRVGPFSLNDAVDKNDEESFKKALKPLDKTLFEALSLPVFLIDEKNVNGFMNGIPLEQMLASSEFCTSIELSDMQAAGVFRKDGSNGLLGILNFQKGKWKYGHVFRDN
ncbi:MAG: tRNA pseudouridine(55) synthase TruB [Treponema sp.]|jgi:tRNA pseudouridine55 synthase|nr:tRNA pseudouridine(55) synthase TruB [Treponema sp.]